MFRFVTLLLGALQTPPYVLAPTTSFPLKSLGLLFEFFISSDIVYRTRVPSTTHWIDPEVVLTATQLLVHWLGNKGGILSFDSSEDPLEKMINS